MNKVIITGADGFIGSSTVGYFLNKGWTVLALDISEVPIRLTEVQPNLIYRRWDASDPEDLPESVWNQEWDVFIHFAWNGSAGPKRLDLDLQVENAKNTAECVKLAKALGCKKFVGAGSLMEYEVAAATHGDVNLTSTNLYGYAKSLAHYLGKLEAQRQGIDFVWGIITNVYGPGETANRFINSTIRKIVIDGETELDFSAGTQNYDFVYIADAANAFYCLATAGINNHEYVITSGQAKPLSEFVCDLIDVCNDEVMPFFDLHKTVDCELPLEIFSPDKMFQETGYKATVPFKLGIKNTKEYIKNGKLFF